MVLGRPFNWNPVGVRIVDLTRSGPTVDPVFKTPVNIKARPQAYDYKAQVNLGRKAQDRKFRTASGDRPQTNAHLVFRTKDLAPYTALPIPQKGWKITALYAGELDEIVVDYLIEEIRYESPLRGRPLLIYVEFSENKDRSPA